MSTIIRILLINFCCITGVHAQKVSAVYKTDDLLRRISHKDTLYVVNFWATWCKPCVEEISTFDSLQKQYSTNPVKVILVCLDFAEHLNKKVNPFLKKKKIRSECVLLDEVNGNDYIDKVHPQWSGAIPATVFVKGKEKMLQETKLNFKKLSEFTAELSQK